MHLVLRYNTAQKIYDLEKIDQCCNKMKVFMQNYLAVPNEHGLFFTAFDDTISYCPFCGQFISFERYTPSELFS